MLPINASAISYRNDLSAWIKYELYPCLFERLDQVLPEHNFVQYQGGWRSKTYLDGTPHKRIDKLVVSKKMPGCLLEQGGEIVSLVEYVMKRDRTDFISAVKSLADKAGLPIPADPSYDKEAYLTLKKSAVVMEQANLYFIYCLETSSAAEKVRMYLSLRGYSSEDVKSMELGYLPSREKLFKFLTVTKGFSVELVEETLRMNHDTRIGASHKLTIPYRSGGQIKGFKFRTIEDEISPKYLNMAGLDRNGGFFNLSGLKGEKEVTLVEGELDCLHATVKGMENIVAMGGSAIHADQIKDAKRRGVTSITLCFDQEPAIHKKLAKALELLQQETGLRIYVATLPDLSGKTDPDRFIKEVGIEAFRQLIDYAVPYYVYQLRLTLGRFEAIEREKSPKDIDRLLDEVVSIAVRINDPLDCDRFTTAFLSQDSIQNLGLTRDSFNLSVNRMRQKEPRKVANLN